MVWLAALTMLLFQGLAICTICAMVTNGLSFGMAMAAAVFEIILGAIIIRMMCRDRLRTRESS
jgi:hypothetical protein